MEYWTLSDLEMLDCATSFQQGAEAALIVLDRMNQVGGEIVQVCGPMSTGGLMSLEANMRRHRAAIKTAKQFGLHVFDQTPLEGLIIRLGVTRTDGSYNMDVLEVLYRIIFESGKLHAGLFLPDWESSTGATWEWRVMKELGLRVDVYPEEWLFVAEAVTG